MAPPQFPTGLRAIRYYVSPVRRFRYKAVREGLLGGNRPWLIAFLTYLAQILLAVMMATFMAVLVPRAAVCAERIQEVLDTEASVTAAPVRVL